MNELGGKVAVVTGGASGIGYALAAAFCAQGMRVAIADIEEPALASAVDALAQRGADVIGVPTDVSRADDVEALRDQALSAFGGVHVVCNNAGIGLSGPVADTPLERWRWALDVNLWGVIHGCRTFLPLLMAQQEGHVVNTASIAGLSGHAMLGAYTASKFAVVGLSECLHHELATARSPVRVSLFCPGPVQTNIRNSERNRPDHVPATHPELRTAKAGKPVLGTDRTPEEMSAACAAQAVLQAIHDDRFYVFTHPYIAREQMHVRTAWMFDHENTV